MDKICVDVTVRLTINTKQGIDIDEVINEMNYKFTSKTDGAGIVDTEITDYNLVNEKGRHN